MAVLLQNAKKQPAIGKVTAITEEEGKVRIEYLKGSWRTAWRPWKCHGGEIWSDNIPKASIILVHFSLNDQDKLRQKLWPFLDKNIQNFSLNVLDISKNENLGSI